jgi:poly(A)-specific ribonuclease
MDIDRYTFPGRALELLDSIASSAFVAIDCEFSGVSRPTARNSLQTLEERYVETRKAARRFHILQVGITCTSLMSTDPQDYYCIRPYNIDISPVLSEELELDRDFTFQGGAVEFLLRNHFNFGNSLSAGVRYLSRAEELEALAGAETKALRMTFEDIILADTDIEARAFMEKARQSIKHWIKTGKPNRQVFTISSQKDLNVDSKEKHRTQKQTQDMELTSFDRRLIHQLVRSEFPSLRTMTRSGSIHIAKYDAKREKDIAAGRMNKAKRMVQENIGFRWIAEALFGETRYLDSMDLKAFGAADANGPRQKAASANSYETNAKKREIIEKLESRPIVLVGHNIFGDLAYLYQNFIADLPETLDEFRLILRRAMPLIIDTKYMATHNCGSVQPPSSLEQVAESLRSHLDPGYGIPVGFEKYLETTTDQSGYSTAPSQQYLHEAGYDGYVTAQVLLKLTSRLGGSVMNLDSAFWKEYGNKLRVFGTAETYFDLTRPTQSATILNDATLSTMPSAQQ